MDIKQQRGQFFTQHQIVHDVMLNLVENKTGTALEPSAGAGHLVKLLEDEKTFTTIAAYELDENIEPVCETPITYQDFFTIPNTTYDVIFGNPPYVAWKNIEGTTQQTAADIKERYSDKTNLYYLFIDKCVDLLNDNGEMIFIVPKEWLYTSSASPLREKIVQTGYISHIIDCGEEKLFLDADVPAILIFRYVKSLNKKETLFVETLFAETLNAAHQNDWETRSFVNKNNRWLLLKPHLADKVKNWGTFKDQYSVKVGIVSGADKIFRTTTPKNFESETIKKYITTKGIEYFIDVNSYPTFESIPEKTAAHLLDNKKDLIDRRIAKFDETNWWKYGAIRNKTSMDSDFNRIYVMGRTRSQKPFFTVDKTEAIYYGGGILGVFEKQNTTIHLTEEVINYLNGPQFREILEAMFITTANKASFQPATLEDVPFPKNIADLK
jgi:adenine-specific DNA-methyltransferase